MEGEKLGKYEVRGTLGRGAMGTVYEGWDPLIARKVAIKTVALAAEQDAEAREALARFQREAQAAGRLQHPNIVGVFDYGETATLAYIVMEFVDGESLKAVLDRGERFPLSETVRIMEELLKGLAFSHERGVVHRDIKPANIMLTRAGGVKIADFGIARIESSSMTQAGTVLGTPSYMSPEQFKGEPVDARTDIYSAGVVLYQLLTGEKPFEGSVSAIMHKVLTTTPPKPSELAVTAPPPFDAVVARAMAKRPEERFASAAAFAEAIRAAPTAAIAPAPAEEEGTIVASAAARGASGAAPKAARGAGQGAGQGAGSRPAASSTLPPLVASAAPASRLPLWIGAVVVLVIVIGGGLWLFAFRPAHAPKSQLVAAAGTPASPRAAIAGATAPQPTHPAPAKAPPTAPAARTEHAAAPAPPSPSPSAASLAPAPAAPAPSAARTSTETASAEPVPPANPAAPPHAPSTTTTVPVASPPATPAVAPLPMPPPAPPSLASTTPTPTPQPTQAAEAAPPAPPSTAPPSTAPPSTAPAATAPAATAPPSTAPAATTPAPAAPARTTAPSAPAPTAPASTEPPTTRLAAIAASPEAIAKAVAGAIAPVPCSLVSGSVETAGSITLDGLAGNQAPVQLHQALAGAAPSAAVDWNVTTFSGGAAATYCRALDLLRPIATPFGAAQPGLQLALQSGRTVLADGDPIAFHVVMPAFPAWLSVDYFSSDGSVAHLMPGPGNPARLRSAGKVVLVQGQPAWTAGPPYGRDMIVAIASAEPLFTTARPESEQASAYLPALAAALDAARSAGAHLDAMALLLETHAKAK